MMKRASRWQILFLLTVGGCQSSSRALEDHEAALSTHTVETDAGFSFEVEDAPSDEDACPRDRFVGEASTVTACRDEHGWHASQLFTSIEGYAVPTSLQKFCVFEWAGEGPPQTNLLPKDIHASASAWLKPDCRVVVPQQSDALTLAQWQDLESTHLAQVDQLTTLPTWPKVQGVRIDVVDTAPTVGLPGSAGGGRSRHGRAMGLLIDRLTCPLGNCVGSVAFSMAMPLYRDHSAQTTVRDPLGGGWFGMHSDLAIAILGAVARWQMLEPNDKLILNISAGWDPIHGGEIVNTGLADLQGAVRAVYKALGHAVCRGALVVAATGNSSGGPERSAGPLLPAGWEEQPAPAQCSDFVDTVVPIGPLAGSGAYHPFLYSVTGVDEKDDALPAGRSNALAQLVAPASHMVVADPSYVHTNIATGSSIAAAVTSAAAANIWVYNTSLKAPDVMQLIYNGGVDLLLTATYCTGATCPSVRRVSVCGALEAYQAAWVPAAQTIDFNCLRRPAETPLIAPAPDYTLLGFDREPMTSDYSWRIGEPCRAKVWSQSSAGPNNPCPREQYYGAGRKPWLEPQPPDDPCPDCRCSKDKLILEIAHDWVGELTSPTLTLEFEGQDMPHKVEFKDLVLRQGDAVVLEFLPKDCTGAKEANLDFFVAGVYSTTSKLIVDP